MSEETRVDREALLPSGHVGDCGDCGQPPTQWCLPTCSADVPLWPNPPGEVQIEAVEAGARALRELAEMALVDRIWGRAEGADVEQGPSGNAWAADPEDVARVVLEAAALIPAPLRTAPRSAAPAPTEPTRPCATWPHLECACRGGLSGGASTCTRRREAERATTPAPTEETP